MSRARAQQKPDGDAHGDVARSGGPGMSALNNHADERRWIAWRNELRGEQLTKVPYAPDGRKAKADDPNTWGSRAQAADRARQIINGKGGGVGIELGDLGTDLHLAGLDLDSCILKDGAVASWAAGIVA